MNAFCLAPPISGKSYTIYGRSQWDSIYGRANPSKKFEWGSEICPKWKGHQRAKGLTDHLILNLTHKRVGDFIWGYFGQCIVNSKVKEAFERESLTGYKLNQVEFDQVKDPDVPGFKDFTFFELVVTGSGGNAHKESGLYLVKECSYCGLKRYSSYQNGLIVDERNWDGTDIFSLVEHPGHILVNEKVKDLILANEFTNCTLEDSRLLRWPKGVICPEDSPRDLSDEELEDLVKRVTSKEPMK